MNNSKKILILLMLFCLVSCSANMNQENRYSEGARTPEVILDDQFDGGIGAIDDTVVGSLGGPYIGQGIN